MCFAVAVYIAKAYIDIEHEFERSGCIMVVNIDDIISPLDGVFKIDQSRIIRIGRSVDIVADETGCIHVLIV